MKMRYLTRVLILSIMMCASFVLSSLSYFLPISYGYIVYIFSTLLLSSAASIGECCGICNDIISCDKIPVRGGDELVELGYWNIRAARHANIFVHIQNLRTASEKSTPLTRCI
jgi:hypothetical protein